MYTRWRNERQGSTASTLAAVLQAAGYRVGLYTSPHLMDFRERIRVDGETVSKEFVVDFVAEYLANPCSYSPESYIFELTTIMAFSWFASRNVDVAVIEVGLGGRLDCTNIITPVLSVIKNISLDHTAPAWRQRRTYCFRKAGIIKPGIPVVIEAPPRRSTPRFSKKRQHQYQPQLSLPPIKTFTTKPLSTTTALTIKGTEWGDFRENFAVTANARML